MTANEILKYCLRTFENLVQIESWGERAVFYNPGGAFKRGVYVLTVKEKDGENDKTSRLEREGIFRVNFALKKTTYTEQFGPPPQRPPKGQAVNLPHDFAAINKLMPHPVYAWMGWVCVLNPDDTLFESLKPLIAESYQYAKEKTAGKGT